MSLMKTFSRCCSGFVTLSRAAAKAGAARLRRAGIGAVSADWIDRASICERCPLRVIHRGVSYCGSPLLSKIDRDVTSDGCGCPCREKAKSPTEHCPLDRYHRAAVLDGETCNCKWCVETANR